MEESAKNQAQNQVQNQNQDRAQKDKDLITGKDIETGSKLLGLALIFAIVLFLALNYFNWVSLSLVYPKIFGFLPHRPIVEKEIKLTITPPPKIVDASQGLESCSVKKEGNPLVEDVRSLPDGTIIGVIRGNIDNISFNMGKKSGAISLISISQGQSHTFKRIEDEEGLVYDATLQKEIKLSGLKRGMTVQISFNCFPDQDDLFKITRIAVIGKM